MQLLLILFMLLLLDKTVRNEDTTTFSTSMEPTVSPLLLTSFTNSQQNSPTFTQPTNTQTTVTQPNITQNTINPTTITQTTTLLTRLTPPTTAPFSTAVTNSTVLSSTKSLLTPTASSLSTLSYTSTAGSTGLNFTPTTNIVHSTTVNVIRNTSLVYYSVIQPITFQWVNVISVNNRKVRTILQGVEDTIQMFKLPTTFLYYGHQIFKIGITTAGFLFTNEYLYSHIGFSHYIAPLKATFNTLNPLSSIKYFQNDTMIIVWYENITLRYQKEFFTFQVIFEQTGKITFNYKEIPIALDKINSTLKVTSGLSDAYALDAEDPDYVELYEYNRISIPFENIVSNRTIIIEPLETCIIQKSCKACFEAKERIPFNCQWCPTLSRCSDGLDRLRQEWLHYACPIERIKNIGECSQDNKQDNKQNNKQGGNKNLGWLALLLIIPIVAFLIWVIYACRNPTSSSGHFCKNTSSQICERMRSCCKQVKPERPGNPYVSFDQTYSNA